MHQESSKIQATWIKKQTDQTIFKIHTIKELYQFYKTKWKHNNHNLEISLNSRSSVLLKILMATMPLMHLIWCSSFKKALLSNYFLKIGYISKKHLLIYPFKLLKNLKMLLLLSACWELLLKLLTKLILN